MRKVTFYVLSILVLVYHDAVYGESPPTTVISDRTATPDTAGTLDTDYSLRLAHGKYGIVEIKIRNSWGHICPNHFRDEDAMVVCREMGYKGGFAYLLIRASYNEFRPLVFSLGCKGTETSIYACSHFMGGNVSECHRNSYAAAYCYDNSGYEFRLVNESATGFGLVEMAIDGEWRPFCGYRDLEIDSRAIDYICQKLGYSAGSFVSRSQRNPVEDVWVTHLSHCDGDPSMLLRCPLILVPNEQPYDSRSWVNNRYRGLNAGQCRQGLLPTIKCF